MSIGGAYKTQFGYKLYGPVATHGGVLLMAIDQDDESPIEVILSMTDHANSIALLTTLFTSFAAILNLV